VLVWSGMSATVPGGSGCPERITLVADGYKGGPGACWQPAPAADARDLQGSAELGCWVNGQIRGTC